MHAVVKLKTGEEVFGRLMIKNENSIELDDAMTMRYHISDESGAPVMYFTKYCIFTQSFNVTIPNECIMHIFKDPVLSLIDFYESELSDCKESYKKPPKSQKKMTAREERLSEELGESYVAMLERMKGKYEVH